MALVKPWRSSGATDTSIRLHGRPSRPIPGVAVKGRLGRVGVAVAVDRSGDDPTDRPTGPDYVRYEDLYVTGDTITQALARLTSPKFVTFPEGRFACRDFATGYQAGITIAPQCRGIVGSGKGTLGSSNGTVFTMEPNSSTAVAKGWIPAQGSSQSIQTNVIKHYPQYAPIYKQFRVEGSAQGHMFHNFQVANTPGAITVEDVLLAGWEGNAGAPPGETFALQATGGVGAHVFRRLEVDGRRTIGGEVFGAAGLTFQKTVGALFDSCNVHHCRAANFIFYDSYDCTILNCVSDATVPSDKALGNGSINMEVFDGIKIIGTKIIGRSGKVHITASGDQGTLTRDGVTHSAASGTLELIDCTNNAAFANGYLYVQTWDPYSRGPYTVGVSTYAYPQDAPKVHKADGTHIPYVWVLKNHYTIT